MSQVPLVTRAKFDTATILVRPRPLLKVSVNPNSYNISSWPIKIE